MYDIGHATEAQATAFGADVNDIVSCSWGPDDDGLHVEGPSLLVQHALLERVTKGREGKGTVFVVASGNGGENGDDCNYDGYANSIYTATIGAVSPTLQRMSFSEYCTAQLAVVYGPSSKQAITTSDIFALHSDVSSDQSCTSNHAGTSAAAPLATGIYALALSIR